MKLRTISEVAVADPDQAFQLLGTAARQLFGKGQKLPDRLAQHTKQQAEYSDTASRPDQTCQKCKYFEKQPGNIHKCKIVEGGINANGWCRLWDGGAAHLSRSTPESTESPSDASGIP